MARARVIPFRRPFAFPFRIGIPQEPHQGKENYRDRNGFQDFYGAVVRSLKTAEPGIREIKCSSRGCPATGSDSGASNRTIVDHTGDAGDQSFEILAFRRIGGVEPTRIVEIK